MKKTVIGRDDMVTCKVCNHVFSELTWGDCPICRSKKGKEEFVAKFNSATNSKELERVKSELFEKRTVIFKQDMDIVQNAYINQYNKFNGTNYPLNEID